MVPGHASNYYSLLDTIQVGRIKNGRVAWSQFGPRLQGDAIEQCVSSESLSSEGLQLQLEATINMNIIELMVIQLSEKNQIQIRQIHAERK